jgi:hypothetical protein
MDSQFDELPCYMRRPGPSDEEIVRRMKEQYFQIHPNETEDDIDVIVEHVSKYRTNFRIEPKIKITSVIVQVTVDSPKEI